MTDKPRLAPPLIERPDLLFQQGQVMQGIKNKVTGIIGSPMSRDLLAARRDDHVIDVALHHHIAVRINDRDRVVGVLVSDQCLAGGPARAFVTGIERCRRQVLEDRLIGGHARTDRGCCATQDPALALAAALLEHGIEFGEVTGTRKRHHEGPPGKAHHPLDLAFVVAFARAAIAVLEHIMRLQGGKQGAALAAAIAKDLRHRQAAPLQGWSLPTEFATLRRLLEARLSQKNRCAAGKREYVQVLRLIETFPLAIVHGAVRDALRLGAISYDAVKHLALCRIESRPARLDLACYPHLTLTTVTTTSASSYMSLLSGAPA